MWKSTGKRQVALIFGLVLFIAVVLVLLFGPITLPEYKQRLLALITASLSACIFVLLSAALDLKIKSFQSSFGEISIQSSGAVAVFIFMLGWWLSPWAPTSVNGHGEGIYRVRITVIDPKGVPVENSEVWSSIGGEPKKVAGGWQFDIPAAATPKDGKLTIYASKKNAFLSGKEELHLEEDFNIAVTVKIRDDKNAYIGGVVTDELGRVVAGATVSVVGHDESVDTSRNGNFHLSAHAAEGQQVQLHVEKKLYEPVTQWHPAGSEPATVVLSRKK